MTTSAIPTLPLASAGATDLPPKAQDRDDGVPFDDVYRPKVEQEETKQPPHRRDDRPPSPSPSARGSQPSPTSPPPLPVSSSETGAETVDERPIAHDRPASDAEHGAHAVSSTQLITTTVQVSTGTAVVERPQPTETTLPGDDPTPPAPIGGASTSRPSAQVDTAVPGAGARPAAAPAADRTSGAVVPLAEPSPTIAPVSVPAGDAAEGSLGPEATTDAGSRTPAPPQSRQVVTTRRTPIVPESDAAAVTQHTTASTDASAQPTPPSARSTAVRPRLSEGATTPDGQPTPSSPAGRPAPDAEIPPTASVGQRRQPVAEPVSEAEAVAVGGASDPTATEAGDRPDGTAGRGTRRDHSAATVSDPAPADGIDLEADRHGGRPAQVGPMTPARSRATLHQAAEPTIQPPTDSQADRQVEPHAEPRPVARDAVQRPSPTTSAVDPIATAPESPTSVVDAPAVDDPGAAISQAAQRRAAAHAQANEVMARAELRRLTHGGSQLDLETDAGQLGTIRIEATDGSDGLQLQLGSDRQSTRAALGEHLQELRDQLQADGFDLGSLDVGVGGRREAADRQATGAEATTPEPRRTPAPTTDRPMQHTTATVDGIDLRL